ncbi:MAG: IS630 transposase-related protein [Bacteroidota bacterium]
MPASYSLDLRSRVVAALLAGDRTQAQVARQFSVGLSTACDWLRRYRATGSVQPTAQRHGPLRLLSSEDDARIAAYLAAEGDLTLDELATRFADDTGRSVSDTTVFRSLVRSEITRKKDAPGRRAPDAGEGRRARGLRSRAARARSGAAGVRG